ncbi:hypothetical protein ATEIFO6365_0005025100 [Aspergillus terreus]|uniref:Uncharacterized protein n=1 Tax=Aspergillus terreus TaxID=33178 RepID=A0A5M3Z4K0_ASPTE|nr:hypothetical protein ATETN484_0007025600 [Aspergillus terreus]GFF16061.1 hypothetical protein ATEIFO6365_0005025100 [Aspergillus terreus]
MSTAAPRSGDRPVLGDSWVVASSYIPKDERPRSSRSSPDRKRSTATDSMTTSASSLSGPELIMPSIYEAPISEASWVSPTVRKRHTSREPTSQKPRAPATQKRPTPKTPESDDQPKPTPSTLPLSNLAERSVRTLINLVLLAAIAHLLVLPELVQQYQTLCAIDALSTLYPASCIPPVPSAHDAMHSKPASPRHNPVLSAQTQLESLLNAALQEMQPLAHALKHSESRLRDLQTDLHHRAPAVPHHELDLEFDGCWQATRAATRKFDSLRADIRAAVDNLVVTAPAPAPAGDGHAVAQDSRLSTQMRRREQYLEQLTARMQSKADALGADLARLEDHLDSIAGVLERHSSGSLGSAGGARHPEGDVRAGRGWWGVIEEFVPGALSAERAPSRASASPPIMRVFQHAAAQHRPVADAVRTLSYRLQALQGGRGM